MKIDLFIATAVAVIVGSPSNFATELAKFQTDLTRITTEIRSTLVQNSKEKKVQSEIYVDLANRLNKVCFGMWKYFRDQGNFEYGELMANCAINLDEPINTRSVWREVDVIDVNGISIKQLNNEEVHALRTLESQNCTSYVQGEAGSVRTGHIESTAWNNYIGSLIADFIQKENKANYVSLEKICGTLVNTLKKIGWTQ